MKLTAQRLLIFFLIILLSAGFGFAYDAIADTAERRSYPQVEGYTEVIAACSAEFGIPEAVIWATVRTESNFVSSAVTEDAIGLMQLTPDQLTFICREILHEEPPDTGMLYDPKTNLRIGCAWLSALYQRYGMWESVYAAWYAGTDAADAWLANPDCLNGQGRLTRIPDSKTAAFVSRMKKAADMYAKLYYEL